MYLQTSQSRPGRVYLSTWKHTKHNRNSSIFLNAMRRTVNGSSKTEMEDYRLPMDHMSESYVLKNITEARKSRLLSSLLTYILVDNNHTWKVSSPLFLNLYARCLNQHMLNEKNNLQGGVRYHTSQFMQGFCLPPRELHTFTQ